MKYRTEHPESYDEGVVTKSVTISALAASMLRDEEIDNQSAFINDLIVDALSDKGWKQRRLLSLITAAREDLFKNHGIATRFEVDQ